VTGPRGEYVGLITIDTLIGHLSALRAEHGADGAARDGAP
jgi:osmoprotectant transport system ATP-binding protein